MAKVLGRPREFDLVDAVHRALDVFWSQGFDATSLATLASAIGVHKPSLYAAFGDKRDLYLAAYDAYQRDAGKLVASALGQGEFREALTAFFAADIELFMAADGRGCFMLATAVPLAHSDEHIAKCVRKALEALHQAITVRVQQASRDGELSRTVEPETAADLVISTHIALAGRARSGEAKPSLEQIAKRLIDLLCPG